MLSLSQNIINCANNIIDHYNKNAGNEIADKRFNGNSQPTPTANCKLPCECAHACPSSAAAAAATRCSYAIHEITGLAFYEKYRLKYIIL